MVRPTLRHRLRAAMLAVVALVIGVGLMTVGASPSSAGSIKGSLVISSVNDAGTGLAGGVAGRSMSVVVTRVDTTGAPLTVNQASGVALSAAKPGTLSGTTTGTIAAGASSTRISGAVYSAVANNVTLTARDTSGPALTDGTISVNIAHTAFKTQAIPRQALDVTDPSCSAPTPDMPTCAFLLLGNGASGDVLMSVGSCDGITSCLKNGATSGELVTASANLKDGNGMPLYTKTAPATIILACDKTLCAKGGVAKFPVAVDLTDSGALAPLDNCPAKGLVGANQDACVDAVQSTKDNAGDVYTYILFVHDIRISQP
jgi:hypothetical protein